MSMECSKCGEPLKPEMEKCPKCGSGDRTIVVECHINAFEMVGIREKEKGFHKFSKQSRFGKKLGKDGEIAKETRIIDKNANRYYHSIEKQNEKGEWVTKHKEDEPLDKHRPKHQDKKS